MPASDDAVVEAAKRRLDDAVHGVATAAQMLTQLPDIRVKEGVVVALEDWRDLQDALGEWRAATQHFLSAASGEIGKDGAPR
jgi:hypothetical protein